MTITEEFAKWRSERINLAQKIPPELAQKIRDYYEKEYIENNRPAIEIETALGWSKNTLYTNMKNLYKDIGQKIPKKNKWKNQRTSTDSKYAELDALIAEMESDLKKLKEAREVLSKILA